MIRLKEFLTSISPLFVIAFLAGTLMFYELGKTTLNNWDEAWFAAVAQDMVMRNDFFAAQWNGQPWFYEPPLLTWVLAFIYKLAGTNEFWLRSFCALAGALTVAMTYLLSLRVFNNKMTAVFSSLVLLSNIEFLFRSRQINVYVVLSLWILIALYAAFCFVERKSVTWILIGSTALGLAFLTARITVVLAFPALGYILFINRERVRLSSFFLGVLLIGVIVGSWYWYSYSRYRNDFIQQYIIGYTFSKIAAVNPGSGESWLFYLHSLRHAFKLWFLMLPIAFGFFWFRLGRSWKMKTLLVLIISFVLPLSLISNKASWFLAPAYPAISMIIGWFLAEIIVQLKRFNFGVVLMVVGLFCFQVIYWQDNFIVPNTTDHQAKIARYAAGLVKQGDILYLDDDYLPVAVFYSNRKVVPLRFNRELDNGVVQTKLASGSYVLSNEETVKQLLLSSDQNYKTVYREKDLLLLQVN